MVTLKLLDAQQSQILQKWDFADRTLIKIGRSPDNDIVLNDPLVSRHHLELHQLSNSPTAQIWHLISKGTNGTLVNGNAVVEMNLSANSIIQLAKGGPFIKVEITSSVVSAQNCTHAGNAPNNLFCIYCGEPLVQNEHFVKQYQILKVLGQGGMGTTYIACDKQRPPNGIRQLLVLKEMNADMVQISKAKELFEREARVLKGLNHHGIPKFYDFFVEGGKKYLAMELVHGEDLEKRIIKKGPVNLQQAITWMMQTCEVLDYIHSQTPPLVHRDIKPANLLIRNIDQRLMVLDFGAVKEIGTPPGTKIGAPAYWSYEQSLGNPQPQSDLYAIGATIIFLLTGIEPDRYYQKKGGSYQYVLDSVPTITPRLAQVIEKACQHKYQDRYQTAKELSLALESCLT
ncbi:MAG TPA: FHA domain-containing serine/threonine-protein kinase [Allocoleopsis sp.]